MKKIIAFAMISLALTSCKTVEITNGEVPTEYLTEAKKLEGTYHGEFNGQKTDLLIKFVGNVPTVSVQNLSKDLISSECNSQVGLLKSAQVSNEGQLQSATFAFDSNLCTDVLGDELYLSTSFEDGKVTLKASIYEYSELSEDRRCIRNPAHGGGNCRVVEEKHWLRGTFVK